ncbi:Protein phosphatase inhibitor 2 [Schistosoma japonicum]|uniref:Protein phosphatase inhibitor 2 n=1 Tax=Schistosoma japonicum TaxID=6182 RepID=A0A4Z2DBE1_SCHJA|nr:Protein phosphatase inhibitor 2 [Schistosoma japonicum]
MSKLNDAEKVSKSILKKSSDPVCQKSFQWDESNILATYHPADKTYGHMKIEEPKTPYVFESEDGSATAIGASFTPEDLAARLSAASQDPNMQLPRSAKIDQEDDEHQRKFREKRKQHYNEFLAVKLAKESLQNDDDDDDDAEERIDKEDEDEDEEVEHNVEQAMINARLNAELSRLSRNAEQPIDITSKIQHSSKSHY